MIVDRQRLIIKSTKGGLNRFYIYFFTAIRYYNLNVSILRTIIIHNNTFHITQSWTLNN